MGKNSKDKKDQDVVNRNRNHQYPGCLRCPYCPEYPECPHQLEPKNKTQEDL